MAEAEIAISMTQPKDNKPKGQGPLYDHEDTGGLLWWSGGPYETSVHCTPAKVLIHTG